MLAAGISLEDVLADAGDDAEWLRPLLETAVEVSSLRRAMPIPAPDASLQRMLSYAEAVKPGLTSPPRLQPHWLRTLVNFYGRNYRLAAGLVTAVMLVILIGSTLTVVAQNSLPGQPLYGLKRISEMLRLNLSQDEDHLQSLVETFNQRRQEEIRLLLEQGKPADVTFSGRIEALTASSVTIDGLVAQIRPETVIDSQIGINARVRFEGKTDPPVGLIAHSIVVIEPAPPTATPLPTATARPTSTPRPTDTPTVTPSATASPSATSTATPAPTATPSPRPSATNTPDVSTPVPPSTGADSGVTDETADDNVNEPVTGDDNENDNTTTEDNQGNDNGDDRDLETGNDNQEKDGGDNSADDRDHDDSGGSDNSGKGSDNSGSGSSNSGKSGNSGSGSGKDDDDK